ncbi:recombinase family protein [Mesorhizobium sp. dw_380]|uniref:recombinase family protein n=1 Tax=Mesorhizobium sp. dw_380 TaxID=2812001 RepID=UPI002033043D|nr:recombinase family protein [Mesorhizobium sp. dw_380]
MKRNEAIQRKAKAEAEKAMRIIGPLRSAGQTLTAIADTMNDMGAKTSRGGKWSATQLMRILRRSFTAGGGVCEQEVKEGGGQ